MDFTYSVLFCDMSIIIIELYTKLSKIEIHAKPSFEAYCTQEHTYIIYVHNTVIYGHSMAPKNEHQFNLSLCGYT